MLHTPKSICHYYNTKKGCKFGTNCTFLHVNIPRSDHFTKGKDEAVRENTTSSPRTDISYFIPSTDNHNQDYGAVKSDVVPQSSISDLSPVSTDEPIGKHEDVPVSSNVQAKPCFQFSKYGNCRFGKRCRFSHSLNEQKNVRKDESSDEKLPRQVKQDSVESSTGAVHKENLKTADEEQDEGHAKASSKKTKKSVTCKYFLTGRCRSGANCRFYHPYGNEKLVGISAQQAQKKEESSDEEDRKPVPPKNRKVHVSTKLAFRPPVKRIEIQRENVTQEVVKKLHTTEITQLKKRFPSDKLEIIQEIENGDKVYCLRFTPSDPDWPFDVDTYNIQLTFPADYPVKIFKATLPPDENLPETVRRYVEVSISEWLEKKNGELESRGVLELTFRPFIHWLDKQMVEIVTQGLKQLQRDLMAKAAGFEFIPASELRERLRGNNSSGSDEDSDGEEDAENDDNGQVQNTNVTVYRKKDEEELYKGPEALSSDEEDNGDVEFISGKFEEANLNAERKGTEIKLRNLQMKETVSTMIYTQIKIIVQCSRCKSNTDLLTPVGRVNMIPCFKCHTQMLLIFRPAVIHAYSSIMGYLDLEGCVPFDLLLQDSAYKLGCMNCNKETKVDSLYPGQPMDSWCKSCHQKLRVAAESAKFTVLLPTSIEKETKDIHEVAVKKVKRVVKDPVIKLGEPLPDNGACKHYKKSYRWFRFPCCGKCYPCDICHEEGEDGHEMVLANRMICGFCCREQPFALEKPCISCNHAMTKSRTSHWEGGLGCRDKIKMSKNDSQKFSSMNKTISRKAQEKQQPNKKKTTKLRHSSA